MDDLHHSEQQLRDNYCPAKEVPERFPNVFSANQWQWAYRNRDQNGISRAVRLFCGKHLVSIPVLLELIEEGRIADE